MIFKIVRYIFKEYFYVNSQDFIIRNLGRSYQGKVGKWKRVLNVNFLDSCYLVKNG